jgi:carboxylesterase
MDAECREIRNGLNKIINIIAVESRRQTWQPVFCFFPGCPPLFFQTREEFNVISRINKGINKLFGGGKNMSEKYPIVEGAEPFYYEGSPIGILVSHGFTGSTQSMRPLGEAYAKAGYTVCGPRLKGHGTHYEEMETTSLEDWIASVEEGFQWLKERCDTIFVTGLSMGGTLTLYLAEHHPDIKAIIAINAAIEIPNMAAIQNTEARYLDAIGSDIKKPDVKELAYEKTPIRSIKEIVKLMSQVKEDLNKISCPAMIFVSEEDHVVPPDNSRIIYDKISSERKELYELKKSYHVATLDYDQAIIIEKSLEFVKENLDLQSGSL